MRATVNVPFTIVTSNDAPLPPPTTFVAVRVVLALFKVPNEPAISFDRSYPVTFFTTVPPDFIMSPLPFTPLNPKI